MAANFVSFIPFSLKKQPALSLSALHHDHTPDTQGTPRPLSPALFTPITNYTGQQNLTFFGTRRKISVLNRTFNDGFKYVSRFSPSPTDFCDSQVKCEKMCIFIYIFHWTTKFNFFLAHGGKYLFLIELLTLNSNM
jgi:hypothetical protein